MNFLERNGFISPNKVIIREAFPQAIENAFIDALNNEGIFRYIGNTYGDFDRYVWREIYHNALSNYSSRKLKYDSTYFINLIKDPNNEWYNKLFILEEFAKWLRVNNYDDGLELLKNTLNSDFEKRNYAYRFIGDNIEEITSQQEIEAIEEALTISGVKTHLQTALQLVSAAKQDPDYRNSIKESISAVEAYCRDITGENTLGKALNKLEAKGVVINKQLKEGFEKLYFYTNDQKTGIRHALMDDTNPPTADEAIFMLISCSAFINYLNKKR